MSASTMPVDVGRDAINAEKLSLSSAVSLDTLCPIELGLKEVQALVDGVRIAAETENVNDATAAYLADLAIQKVTRIEWAYRLEANAFRARVAELEKDVQIFMLALAMIPVPAARKKQTMAKATKKAGHGGAATRKAR